MILLSLILSLLRVDFIYSLTISLTVLMLAIPFWQAWLVAIKKD